MVAFTNFLCLVPLHTVKDEQKFSVSEDFIEEPVQLPELSTVWKEFGGVESMTVLDDLF